jgi:hypothetical protein
MRYTRKKKRALKQSKYNKNKKGGVGSSSSSRKIKRSSGNSTTWRKLPCNKKSLCSIVPAEGDQYNECEHFDKKKWLKVNYDISQVSDDVSPLEFFFESVSEKPQSKYDEKYARLKNGVHNYILYYDELIDRYVLVTSFYNAVEYGSKHNIIVRRAKIRYPYLDNFIISGELKKYGFNITFNDESSQYYVLNNGKSMKTRLLIDELHSIPNWQTENLEVLKKYIYALNNETTHEGIIIPHHTDLAWVNKIKKATTLAEIEEILLLPYSDPSSQSDLYKEYKARITEVMSDALRSIFKGIKLAVSSVGKFSLAKKKNKDYGEQRNIIEYTKQLCALNQPDIHLDIYADDECLGERVKDACI